ncbi:ribosomal-protein-alanine N-acetyltransferase [candidate division KSB1 bacterium]|jgi:ribosomal-protein-alanine N-acetyltransferase|nr:MAG: ribosomal-protein-alanine N-acetyltransferase [candidate division KSB1 bacterium]
MNWFIRPMTEKDLETIVALEKRIFSDPWSRSSFEAELVNKKYSYPLVMELDGKIVAYAVIWHFFEELHIANIAVHPEYRRMGLGKAFMEYILENFANAQFAFLEVRRSNKAAINLYESFGFKVLSVRKRYYRDGEDALVMVKDLRK